MTEEQKAVMQLCEFCGNNVYWGDAFVRCPGCGAAFCGMRCMTDHVIEKVMEGPE